eukprot:CAMPEP_0177759760 /NCGR_PEP_ID=MMETSP0491_2-20121128/4900_1 /TAXON_ID=63592 /ORGANISM="Tetraselmis chuii, Strain PLY429" /LENGTH=84 /DNA_ID=CAMNT_0019275603 /DNA_START=346 /DNA_END=600 /DNA_ORIENTATION=+
MPAGLAVRELCPEQAVQVATQPLGVMAEQLRPLRVHLGLRAGDIRKCAHHYFLQVGKIRPHVQCHVGRVDVGVGDKFMRQWLYQ